LRGRGHAVITYEEDNHRIPQLGRLRTALRTIWSLETSQRIGRLLANDSVDLIYAHNTFPLISPSLYDVAASRHIPVVQVLHNYRLLCLNAFLMRGDRPCEDCMGRPLALPGIRHACYRGSRAGSLSLALMLWVNRLRGVWDRRVGRYFALTAFARQKFIQGGLPADRLVVRPNYLMDPVEPGTGSGNYALFVGRLSSEKGILPLLATWQQLSSRLPLWIAGHGPLAPQVEAAASANPLIRWLGSVPGSQVSTLLQRATFLVFPSLWYEGLPRVLIESFAAATPVLASDLGAMPSLVTPGKTGWLLPAGDPAAWAAGIEAILADPAQLPALRRGARREFDDLYTPAAGYAQWAAGVAPLLSDGTTRLLLNGMASL
ncbi:MAG TPA: glycosyltransferase, partial [Anaerolineaceae bacterium]|nr:glycosyltransferase [Anaerolineaceae bacterium]